MATLAAEKRTPPLLARCSFLRVIDRETRRATSTKKKVYFRKKQNSKRTAVTSPRSPPPPPIVPDDDAAGGGGDATAEEEEARTASVPPRRVDVDALLRGDDAESTSVAAAGVNDSGKDDTVAAFHATDTGRLTGDPEDVALAIVPCDGARRIVSFLNQKSSSSRRRRRRENGRGK